VPRHIAGERGTTHRAHSPDPRATARFRIRGHQGRAAVGRWRKL